MKINLNNRFQKHILFWLFTIVFYILIQIPNEYTKVNDSLIWIILILPVYVFCTYTLIYFLLPYYLLKKRYYEFSFLLLIWVLISAFLNDVFSAFIQAILLPNVFNQPCNCKFGWTMIKENYFYSFEYFNFLVPFSACAIKLFEFWNEKQKLNKKLLKEKIEIEINIFKAQLHPNFLFKTLDNLHELTAEKSKQTSTVVMKFSHLLSYLLYESQTKMVPLEKEIEMIIDFIYLEKIQFGENLEVSLNFTGDIESQEIAPLLLFQLIEMAFQNMDNQDKNNIKWVSLDLSVQNKALNFKLIFSQNTYAKLEESVFFTNFQKYLEHSYINQYVLKTTSEVDFFLINLHLKLTAEIVPDIQKLIV